MTYLSWRHVVAGLVACVLLAALLRDGNRSAIQPSMAQTDEPTLQLSGIHRSPPTLAGGNRIPAGAVENRKKRTPKPTLSSIQWPGLQQPTAWTEQTDRFEMPVVRKYVKQSSFKVAHELAITAPVIYDNNETLELEPKVVEQPTFAVAEAAIQYVSEETALEAIAEAPEETIEETIEEPLTALVVLDETTNTEGETELPEITQDLPYLPMPSHLSGQASWVPPTRDIAIPQPDLSRLPNLHCARDSTKQWRHQGAISHPAYQESLLVCEYEDYATVAVAWQTNDLCHESLSLEIQDPLLNTRVIQDSLDPGNDRLVLIQQNKATHLSCQQGRWVVQTSGRQPNS